MYLHLNFSLIKTDSHQYHHLYKDFSLYLNQLFCNDDIKVHLSLGIFLNQLSKKFFFKVQIDMENKLWN